MNSEEISTYAQTPRAQYLADGVQQVFPYTFTVFHAEDMVVIINGQTSTIHYVVSGCGNTEGGAVTFDQPPMAGTIVTLLRRLVIKRVTEFQDGSALRARALNAELDYQVAVSQQLADDINRSIKAAPEDTPVAPLPSSMMRAGKMLGFDSAGAPVAVAMDGAVNSVTANGGTTPRLLGDWFADHINVKAFGAAGDGVADDTNAIDQAVLAVAARGGGVLYFPTGIYSTLRGLRFNMSRIRIIGDGPGRTIIRKRYSLAANVMPASGNDRGDVITIASPIDPANPLSDAKWPTIGWIDGTWNTDWSNPANNDFLRNIAIENLTIDGNRWHFEDALQNNTNKEGPHGLRVKYAVGLRVENVEFLHSFRNSLFVTGVYDYTVKNCRFDDFGEQGFQSTGGEHFIIEGNRFFGNPNCLSRSLTAIDLEPDASAAGLHHIRHGVITGNISHNARFGIALCCMKNISGTQTAWSGAAAYAEGATVTGSNGQLHIALIGGGQIIDPVADVLNSYWKPIAETDISQIDITGNKIHGCDGDEGNALQIGKYNKVKYLGITVSGNLFHHKGTVPAVQMTACRDVTFTGNRIDWPTTTPGSTAAALSINSGCHSVTIAANDIRSGKGTGVKVHGPTYSDESAAALDGYILGAAISGNTIVNQAVQDGSSFGWSITTWGPGVFRDLSIGSNNCTGGIAVQGADNANAKCNFALTGNVIRSRLTTEAGLLLSRVQNWGMVDGNWITGMIQVDKNGSQVSTASFGVNRAEGWTFTGMTTADMKKCTFALFTSNTAAPANSTATGTAGEMRFDGVYLYICRAPGDWVRSATSTF